MQMQMQLQVQQHQPTQAGPLSPLQRLWYTQQQQQQGHGHGHVHGPGGELLQQQQQQFAGSPTTQPTRLDHPGMMQGAGCSPGEYFVDFVDLVTLSTFATCGRLLQHACDLLCRALSFSVVLCRALYQVVMVIGVGEAEGDLGGLVLARAGVVGRRQARVRVLVALVAPLARYC